MSNLPARRVDGIYPFTININGVPCSPTDPATVTASVSNALTAGTNLQMTSGTTFDGSTAQTISTIDNPAYTTVTTQNVTNDGAATLFISASGNTSASSLHIASYQGGVTVDAGADKDIALGTTGKGAVTVNADPVTTNSAIQTLSNKSLIAPALGTPASGDLSNCTNFRTGYLTGTMDVTQGGTGQTAFTIGQTLYGGVTPNTLSKLAGNTTTTRKFLEQTGTGTTSAAPVWDTVTKTDVGLSAVENTALSTWTGSSNLSTVGTVGTGVWNGSKVSEAYGGTNQSTYAVGDTLYASGTNTLAKLAGNTSTTKKALVSSGNGSVTTAPAWTQLGVSDLSTSSFGTGSIVLGTNVTSFVPTLTDESGNSFTVSGYAGEYYNFGGVYIFRGRVAWTSKGSTTAGQHVVVGGFPANFGLYTGVMVGYASGMGAGATLRGLGMTGTSTMHFIYNSNNYLLISNVSASGEFYFSGQLW